jgi:hypothetical protein
MQERRATNFDRRLDAAAKQKRNEPLTALLDSPTQALHVFAPEKQGHLVVVFIIVRGGR